MRGLTRPGAARHAATAKATTITFTSIAATALAVTLGLTSAAIIQPTASAQTLGPQTQQTPATENTNNTNGGTTKATANQQRTELDWFADEYKLPAGHVFESVTWERLQYLLGYKAENGSYNTNIDNPDYPGGSFAIVFGGPENKSSQAALPLINEVAKTKGVSKVYHFDPKLDGDRLDITDPSLDQAWTTLWSYPQNGSGIKERLKNIDPNYTSDSTYLFIYNKANADKPVLAGKVSTATSFDEAGRKAYEKEIGSVFDAAGLKADGKANTAVYSHIDYYQSRINNVPATKEAGVGIPDSAKKDFTVQTVTYPELIHLLNSEGDFTILFGGTWCPYTTPTINTANTAALKNGVKKIYQFDFKLDGNSSNRYIRDTTRSHGFGYLYGRIVNDYLKNLSDTKDKLLPNVVYNPDGDKSNGEKEAAKIGVPFFIEYNKDHKDANGKSAPVVNEWEGYDPFGDYNYGYAWYQAEHLKEFLAKPDVRVRELGRPVDPSVDNVLRDTDREDGLNSATLAIPGLDDFFANVTAHRAEGTRDIWAKPDGTPRAANEPSETGGCGTGTNPIDPTEEKKILSQNGNDGYDVQNYNVNLSYEKPLGTTAGGYRAETTVTAKATESLDKVEFDLRDLKIDESSVTVNDKPATVSRDDDKTKDQYKIVVKPTERIASGSTFTVKLKYYAFASADYKFGAGTVQGFVPSSDSDGASSIGQPNGPSFWFPSNNNLTDRATYDVTLTAPSSLTGVSVGNLVSQTSRGTLTTRHWQQKQQVLPYQVFASFGDYYEFAKDVKIGERTIPLHAYVAKSIYDDPINTATVYDFAANIDKYVDWASSKLGDYPYDSLGFVFENLDGVDYNLETAGRPFYAGVPDKTTFIHELIHQWLGDSTSIADWKDLWLNEGFAVYLSNDFIDETEKFSGDIDSWYRDWFKTNNDPLFWGIAPANPKNAYNLFGNGTYGRGSYALAALRTKVGDDTFFRILKGWAQDNAGKSVTTDDFVKEATKVSGADLTDWSKTWLYAEAKPAAWPVADKPANPDNPGNNGGSNGNTDNNSGSNGNAGGNTTDGNNGNGNTTGGNQQSNGNNGGQQGNSSNGGNQNGNNGNSGNNGGNGNTGSQNGQTGNAINAQQPGKTPNGNGNGSSNADGSNNAGNQTNGNGNAPATLSSTGSTSIVSVIAAAILAAVGFALNRASKASNDAKVAVSATASRHAKH